MSVPSSRLQGCSRCIAYHPTEYAIACGFDDGCVRIFDIATTSLLEEYKQHDSRVLALAYSQSATRLFSASDDGGLCAYDVLHAYQPFRAFSATQSADSPCLAISADDTVLAVGGLQVRITSRRTHPPRATVAFSFAFLLVGKRTAALRLQLDEAAQNS